MAQLEIDRVASRRLTTEKVDYRKEALNGIFRSLLHFKATPIVIPPSLSLPALSKVFSACFIHLLNSSSLNIYPPVILTLIQNRGPLPLYNFYFYYQEHGEY
jgi:hypothetical protein